MSTETLTPFDFFHSLVKMAIQSWPDETPDALAARITGLLWVDGGTMLQAMLDQRRPPVAQD